MDDFSMKSTAFIDAVGNFYFDVSITDHGVTTEKRLTVDDYVNMIKSSELKVENYITVPKVSDCVYDLKMTPSGDSFTAVVVLPAMVRPFCYLGKHLRIPFPPLICKIEVKMRERKETFLYALDTDNPSLDSPLFHYPFGNVDSNGHCCFGNIRTTPDVARPETILNAFLCGETNEDYWNPGKCNAREASQGDLLRRIMDTDIYPQQLLAKCGKTVADLLN